jgi:hypothetical protein
LALEQHTADESSSSTPTDEPPYRHGWSRQLLLQPLLGFCLPAAVDVDADVDAPNPDVSRNHDVYRFCREWSCFEGQADVKRMVKSSPHYWSWFSLEVALKFFGVLCFRKSTFPVVVVLPPPEEEVAGSGGTSH